MQHTIKLVASYTLLFLFRRYSILQDATLTIIIFLEYVCVVYSYFILALLFKLVGLDQNDYNM